jgi:SDR family mycofactocin-dependent oxidoreductase
MGRLDGKVAFITGAARGQGRAQAIRLAQEGADIIAMDLPGTIEAVPYPLGTADDLARTVVEVEALDRRIIALEGDVRSQARLDEVVAQGIAEFDHIDILIANAGVWHLGSFWELTDEQWDTVLGVNLTGIWHAAKALAPHFIQRRSGSIVMTSSLNGLVPGPSYAHYTASKHGVIGLMRAVALELGPYAVRCNAVCPGYIDTQMTNWPGAYDMFAGHPGGTREEAIGGGKHVSALAGQGALSAKVIADAALWLVSDDAASVTGIEVPIDAGGHLLPGFNHNPVE